MFCLIFILLFSGFVVSSLVSGAGSNFTVIIDSPTTNSVWLAPNYQSSATTTERVAWHFEGVSANMTLNQLQVFISIYWPSCIDEKLPSVTKQLGQTDGENSMFSVSLDSSFVRPGIKSRDCWPSLVVDVSDGEGNLLDSASSSPFPIVHQECEQATRQCSTECGSVTNVKTCECSELTFDVRVLCKPTDGCVPTWTKCYEQCATMGNAKNASVSANVCKCDQFGNVQGSSCKSDSGSTGGGPPISPPAPPATPSTGDIFPICSGLCGGSEVCQCSSTGDVGGIAAQCSMFGGCQGLFKNETAQLHCPSDTEMHTRCQQQCFGGAVSLCSCQQSIATSWTVDVNYACVQNTTSSSGTRGSTTTATTPETRSSTGTSTPLCSSDMVGARELAECRFRCPSPSMPSTCGCRDHTLYVKCSSGNETPPTDQVCDAFTTCDACSSPENLCEWCVDQCVARASTATGNSTCYYSVRPGNDTSIIYHAPAGLKFCFGVPLMTTETAAASSTSGSAEPTVTSSARGTPKKIITEPPLPPDDDSGPAAPWFIALVLLGSMAVLVSILFACVFFVKKRQSGLSYTALPTAGDEDWPRPRFEDQNI